MIDIGMFSNATGAAMFTVLALLLLPRWRGQLLSSLLILCCLVSALQFGALAYYYGGTYTYSLASLQYVEALRNGAWFSFLVTLLSGTYEQGAGARTGLMRAMVVLVAPVVMILLLVTAAPTLDAMGRDVNVDHVGFLVLSVAGLVLVEMIFRNTRPERRWAVKFLCFGVGGIFAYDFYMYADAILLRRLDADLWNARAAVNACTVPLLAISAARNRHWKLDLFVSRQVVFHSTAIIVAGLYLLVMAAAGYYIRYYGGTWGGALQSFFFFGAVLLLLVLMFSTQVRAQLKVFLAKHFFTNKYDYREEWLRFTHTLSQVSGDIRTTRQTVIGAIAAIVNSRGGILWLRDEPSGYRVVAAVEMDLPEQAFLNDDSSLVRFLGRTGWVVNLDEFRTFPQNYEGLDRHDWLATAGSVWLIVPLMLQEQLLGFVYLAPSHVGKSFNWEDSDLLKTVGRQTASYLALLSATDSLAQARQFEAFNRLSAFVVHDLKNLVAQLSLIGANSAKHMNNPEFVRDALQTVRDAVAKMNRLLSHLRKGGVDVPAQELVDLAAVVAEVVNVRGCVQPVPSFSSNGAQPLLHAHRDRLASVVEHIIQNAQEATPPEGKVEVKLERAGAVAVIEVTDTGCGMDEAFIHDRLFRPFDTTKGNAGMGIGVFESREVVRSLGGDITVDSTPGNGTTFKISLPVADQFSALPQAVKVSS